MRMFTSGGQGHRDQTDCVLMLPIRGLEAAVGRSERRGCECNTLHSPNRTNALCGSLSTTARTPPGGSAKLGRG